MSVLTVTYLYTDPIPYMDHDVDPIIGTHHTNHVHSARSSRRHTRELMAGIYRSVYVRRVEMDGWMDVVHLYVKRECGGVLLASSFWT